jgi:putative redox protein
MGVSINAIYEGSLHCMVIHGPSGMSVVTDAPVDNGGKGEAFSPTDMVASALGCCILTIMGIVAERSSLDLAGTRAHIIKEMTSQPTRRIGKIRVSVQYPDSLVLSEEDKKKLETAAMACPVKQSLHPDVELVIDFH